MAGNSNWVLTPILSAISHYWWLFLLLIAAVVIKAYLETPKIKGKVGEKFTKMGLKLKLDPEKYEIFENLVVPDSRGTTQVDLIILSIHGLFVIEVKNYNGWIFCNEKDKYWTQVIHGKKTKFYNPLRQNYRHVKALAEYLGIEEKKIIPVVFFAGDAKFKTPVPPGVLTEGLSEYVKSFKDILFSSEELRKIKRKLERISKDNLSF